MPPRHRDDDPLAVPRIRRLPPHPRQPPHQKSPVENPTPTPNVGPLQVLEHRDGCILMSLPNLLTEGECEQILDLKKPTEYRSLEGRYEISKRRGSRLLALDDHLASLLWSRLSPHLEPAIQTNHLSTTPLCFSVDGTWALHGVNPAMRINLYEPHTDFFGPHVDAQFCPSADERSQLLLVVYLTDDFEGGETPDAPHLDGRGLTVAEAIERRGGLDKGYDAVVVTPRVGHAVLFSHDIVHEARGFTEGDTMRCLMRTDVVVRREGAKGFKVTEEEAADYRVSLEWFREAQNAELEGKVERAGELYERNFGHEVCVSRGVEGGGEEAREEERV
ncbi:hypothetical protein HDU96_009644 [Phlyctochytrium bullatum]|nr:hypothetical protein HDU96_009644 [Phlyctochytrium bullatum]